MLMCLEKIKLLLPQLFIGNILSSLGIRYSLTLKVLNDLFFMILKAETVKKPKKDQFSVFNGF